MSFRAVATSSARPLSVSEKRVVSVLLASSEPAVLTAAEVATKASTHESTVVRLAQKLGYRGYPELRADLARDSGTSTTESAMMRADSGPDIGSFITDEVAAMTRLPEFVSQADLAAAARTLHDVRTVYLYATSDEKPVLEVLARRLRRLGKVVVLLGFSAKDLAEHFVSFDSSCALISFALREAPTHLAPLVSEAQRRGGATILITDVPGHHFRPAPSHLLAAVRASDSEYNTLLIPIALCYALQLAIYHLEPGRYEAVRNHINDLTRLGRRRRRDPAAHVTLPRWQVAVGAQAALAQVSWVGMRLMTSYRAIELGADTLLLGVVAAAFALPALLGAMPLGRLADRHGGARLSFAGMLTAAAGGVLVIGARAPGSCSSGPASSGSATSPS